MTFNTPANALAAAIALALAAPAAVAQTIYHEAFNIGIAEPAGCHTSEFPGGAGTYPFPAGWQLFNVDNRTPAASVAYVNDAWEVREDFSFNVLECAAFSTSWYSPAGQADDWMWTPAISIPAGGALLSWRAVAYDPAYPDGYEVRVLDEAPTVANLLDSEVVFSVGAEPSTWTPHTVSLSAYAGQTIHVAFRNNSNDKFLLLIDDVMVKGASPDLSVEVSSAYVGEYARLPTGWTFDATLAAELSNTGTGSLTNVVGAATALLDGSPTASSIAAEPVATLAEGASAAAVFDLPLSFDGDGTWSVAYAFSADESEPDMEDNAVEVTGLVIGGDELARHEDAPVSTLGIGAGNGGELGVSFTLAQDASFRGVRFGLQEIPSVPEDPKDPDPCPGFDFVANLRVLDDVTGEPGAVLDTTVPVPCQYDDPGVFDADFVGGPLELAAGTYVLTLVEPVAGPTLRLSMHTQRFTPGTTWVTWPTSPDGWMHFEAFGANFMRTPSLSLLTALPPEAETPIFVDGFELPPASVAAGVTRVAAPALVPGRPTRAPVRTQFAPER